MVCCDYTTSPSPVRTLLQRNVRVWFTTCFGADAFAGDADDGGHPVSWTQDGTTAAGDACPRCVTEERRPLR